MTFCKFNGFTKTSPFLYDGIDYPKLAAELYDATDGIGTNNGAVYKVFVQAVGTPLMRLMPQSVTVAHCVASLDKRVCTLFARSDRSFLSARTECAYQSVGRDDYSEASSGDFERDIRDEALNRLQAAYITVLKNHHQEVVPETLRSLIVDEMSERDANILMSFQYQDWSFWDFGGWLFNGLPGITAACMLTLAPDQSMKAGAEAVCKSLYGS